MKLLFGFIGGVCVSSMLYAQPIQGMSFSHLNWEVVCSNTGTCRAAGYQNDEGASEPASILLTRHAGAKQAVNAEFVLASYQEPSVAKLKNLHFYINGKDLGRVSADDKELPIVGKLSAPQVKALLQQLRQKSVIEFKNSYVTWQVSDAGMSAVLLKMDDFQKRVGTVGALVKKGNVDESKVLIPQAKIMVKKVKTANEPFLTLQPNTTAYKNLHTRLMAAAPSLRNDEMCEGLYDYDADAEKPQEIELYKLSNNKVLAMTLCWRAAYNEGYGAWLLDDSFKSAKFISAEVSGFENGILSSSQKGRGVGDCWEVNEWVWNGQQFIQTRNMWTGQCKGFAGGAWSLDLIEAEVQ